jgi:LPS O-antigen subunit length determinant protein (WzzB/FepE family)
LFNYVQDLKLAYKANLNALEINYEALNKIEQSRLSDKIIVLQENFKLAESLGIRETPFKELENIQLRVLDGKDYLLGTKPLAQQIEILTARQGKSLAPFSLELRNLEIWRDQMNSDVERLSALGNIRLFFVVNSPEASLDPVKPKKVLIFLAVIFISIVFGIFIVLLRPAILARRVVG